MAGASGRGFFGRLRLHPTAHPSRRASPRDGVLPSAASASSIAAKRRSNFRLVARSAASGSASRWRARLTTANSRSPISPATLSRPPRRARLRSRPLPRGSWPALRFGSFQSKPTLPAFCCSFSARVRAGRPTATPVSALASSRRLAPFGAFRGPFLGLDPLPEPLTAAVSSRFTSPNTCGWRRISFSVIACTTSAKRERALLLRHAGVEDHLEQEVAEFVSQVVEVAAADRVRDLVGFLDRVGRDALRSSARGPTDSRCRACAAPP